MISKHPRPETSAETPQKPAEPDQQVLRAIGAGPQGKRKNWLWWSVNIFHKYILLGAGGAGIWWWSSPQEVKFLTLPVKRGAITIAVTATGTLEPTNTVQVGCEVSGHMKTVEVDFNYPVKKGQVLATLDTEQFEADVARANASLRAAEAEKIQAEATLLEKQQGLKRTKELFERKIAKDQELEIAQADLARAEGKLAATQAQVSVAQAALEGEQTKLRKAVIVSPIDGIVLVRQVEQGQTVAAAFQTPVLFELAEDLKKMELRVDVDEADVGQVREGQRATFTVDAYTDKDFPAVITSLRFAPRRVQDVVTYEAILVVDNSELLLRPGMTATADIVVDELSDVLLVPNESLRFTPPVELLPKTSGSLPPAGQVVWKLEQGKPVAIPIKPGQTDGRFTEVLQGDLEPGLELLIEVGT